MAFLTNPVGNKIRERERVMLGEGKKRNKE